jgi:hypothetical protein
MLFRAETVLSRASILEKNNYLCSHNTNNFMSSDTSKKDMHSEVSGIQGDVHIMLLKT